MYIYQYEYCISCEIRKFLETCVYKLRVILRSRVLGTGCVGFKSSLENLAVFLRIEVATYVML